MGLLLVFVCGFISGIVASEQTPNLFNARTDIGELYRWNEAAQRWIPLVDWVGWDNWGYNGVTSVAIDPTNNNVVYAAVGTYTNTWDPNNGAILKSADQGRTWSITQLPFRNGGNMPARGNGERLAVTDANGVAKIQTAGTNRGSINFTFCVTKITHASLTYNSAANVVTCDSN